jgi:hypothetical protein
VSGKFTLNGVGIDVISGQVEDGLVGLGKRIAGSASGHAPRRQGGYKRKEVSLKVSRTNVTDEPVFTTYPINGPAVARKLGKTPSEIQSYNRTFGEYGGKTGPIEIFSLKTKRRTRTPPTSFTFQLSPRRKTSASASRAIRAKQFSHPGLSLTARGFMVEFGKGKPLHESIHAREVEGDGNRLTVRIVADSDHAMPMEVGFHHKGGTEFPGYHYMIKGLMDHDGEIRNGSFIKKR